MSSSGPGSARLGALEGIAGSARLKKYNVGIIGYSWATAHIDAIPSSWIACNYFHTHLVGSEGSLLDNKFHSQKLGGLNQHAWSQLSMSLLDSGDVADHPYRTQFQAFFDALDAGRDMPLTSFQDVFASHRVIAAADKSAAEGRR
jgi:predicted dehydrogenase